MCITEYKMSLALFVTRRILVSVKRFKRDTTNTPKHTRWIKWTSNTRIPSLTDS